MGMIFGGTDLVIGNVRHGLNVVADVVHKYWPRMVIQDSVQIVEYGVSLDSALEILIYRNKRIMAKWERQGFCDELRDTMVHALYSGGELTIVVDDGPMSIKIYRDIERAAWEDHVKQEIEKTVNDFYDNADRRDPYDVTGAILNGRDTLIENLYETFVGIVD